jgi:signal transduction histidine kinase/ActR/RegA family two-component response regulator
MSAPAPPGAVASGPVLPVPLASLAGPCPALRLSATGHIVAVNAALCQVLQAPASALCGCALEVWLSPASRVMMQTLVQPLLKLHGQVSELALTLRTAEGAAVEVLLYAAREGAAPQDPVLLQLAPIRQRRRIEAELQRVKRAADQAPGLIYQLERDDTAVPPRWCFAYANEAIRHLYGTSAEAAARSAEVVFGQFWPDDRRALLAALDQAAAAPDPYRVLVRVGPAGEVPRWHEVAGVVRLSPTGGQQWHGHVADVSDRVAMQDALIQREALERLARARSEFIGRVSHELRTPLNGILGFAQLLASDPAAPLSGQQAERMAVLLDSARHLRAVVEELLDISRIEAGQLRLQLGPVPVPPLLAQLAATLGTEARAQGVALLSPPPDGRPCAVLAESQRLRQVLTNLLSNAVKYNRPGGAVWVQCAEAGSEHRIDVCDNGLGLDDQQLAGLFQPFNRVGAERSAVQGTGLGLVISRQLVQLMGGRLTVESTPGVGSRFSVWLPAAPMAADAPAPAPVADAVAAGVAQGRVLYVEDNDVNVLVMQAMLARCPGVQLTVAVDAASAVAAALAQAPDLLLIDMNLPDASGLELLARLRALPGLAAVPAVVVSASAEPQAQEAARRAGFDGYWTKPLDLAATLAGVEAMLARR